MEVIVTVVVLEVMCMRECGKLFPRRICITQKNLLLCYVTSVFLYLQEIYCAYTTFSNCCIIFAKCVPSYTVFKPTLFISTFVSNSSSIILCQGRSKQHHYELCWSCCLNVDKGAEGCVGQDAAIVNSHKDEVMPPIPKGNLKTSPHFDLWERNRLQDLTDNRGAFNARLQKNSFLSQSPSSSKLSRPSTAYTATAMVTATATEQGERSVLTSSYSNNRLKLKDDNNVNSRASIFQNRPATATSGGVRNSGNKNWSSSPPNTRIIFS